MKSYCIFSKEAIKLMNGNRGKLAAMAGHAYLHSWWDAYERCNDSKNRYHKEAIWPFKYKNSMLAKKVTLCVETTQELVELYENLKDKHPCAGITLVKDAGLTVFDGPTIVCVGYGPIPSDLVVNEIASLSVLK